MNSKTQGSVILDKWLMPQDTPIANPPYTKKVPWEFGVMQGIQAKKIRASTGQFKNLTGTATNQVINTGTINTSLFQNGTVANSVISGATVSNPSETGGTYTNPTINTGTVNTSLIANGTFNNGTMGTAFSQGGTFNNAVFGTPSLVGGTVNAGTYTGGVTGTAVYVKTVSPGTTFGTIITTNGLVTSIN